MVGPPHRLFFFFGATAGDLILNGNMSLLRVSLYYSLESFLMYTSLFPPWQFISSSKSHLLLLFGRADYFYIFQLKAALAVSTAEGNLMS